MCVCAWGQEDLRKVLAFPSERTTERFLGSSGLMEDPLYSWGRRAMEAEAVESGGGGVRVRVEGASEPRMVDVVGRAQPLLRDGDSLTVGRRMKEQRRRAAE